MWQVLLFPPSSGTEPPLGPEAPHFSPLPRPCLGSKFPLLVSEEAGRPEPEEEDVRVEAEPRKEAALRPGGQRRGGASKAGEGKERHL